MISRKTRIIVVLIALAGFFGYRHFIAPRAGSDGTEPSRTAAAPPAKPRMYGRIAFTPCTLAPQSGAVGVAAQCGSFTVPENPRAPDGRKIDLRIAVVPADEGADIQADPVFMLAGGPGQSAVDSYPSISPAFRHVLRARDVVLVDQRGTGKSNLLACRDVEDDTAGADEANADAVAQSAESAARTCMATLAKHADLRFYTTTDAVRDLDAVRQAMGYDSINLIGVSYGTRVAQQYAMRHPAATRSIVLDSVVPNTLGLGNIFARNLDDALALQFAVCSRNPECLKQTGDPRQELGKLLATLRQQPPVVRYRDASTGQWHEDALTAGQVAGMVRMYAYMPALASLLPVLIHDANQGEYESLASLSRMFSSEMDDAMAIGMQLSVLCSEDADSLVARAEDADTVLGNRITDAMAAMCTVWPKGAVPADFHKPLSTVVPALVLEGEFDPVTPPRYGTDTVRTLPKGRLLVLKGQGHNVIGAGCMPKLFAQFLDSTDAKALDATCLDALPRMPPFVSLTGWQP